MDITGEGADGLDGLAQLRALVASGRRAPIADTLDFTLVELERGLAVFAGQPGRPAYNPIGSVHGGYAATLLDSACGCAVHTELAAGQGYTTLELKVAYHPPCRIAADPCAPKGASSRAAGVWRSPKRS